MVGNKIIEITKSDFSKINDVIIVVFSNKFKKEYENNFSNIKYTRLADRQQWYADYYDAKNKIILACSFD